MNNAVIPVELSEPSMQDAAELAEKNGMSVSSWISLTVEEHLRNERMTAEFYRRRAVGGSGKDLLAILDQAPDRVPDPGDEL
jgi:hypothetical protein